MTTHMSLAFGLLVLLGADLVLSYSNRGLSVSIGVTLWGVHMGMTQGVLTRMVADTSPKELLGTAYGLFNLVSGGAMLVATALAGLLWDRFGAAQTFLAGAAFTAIALSLLLVRGAHWTPRPVSR